jgi:hypothetical protein
MKVGDDCLGQIIIVAQGESSVSIGTGVEALALVPPALLTRTPLAVVLGAWAGQRSVTSRPRTVYRPEWLETRDTRRRGQQSVGLTTRFAHRNAGGHTHISR